MNQETKYYNAINQVPQIGPKRFQRLLDYFGSMEQVWQASFLELEKAGLEKRIIEDFIAHRQKINPDQEIEKVTKENIEIIISNEAEYPKQLKEIYNHPAILYVRGSFQKSDELSLAVVGARKYSPYGKQVVSSLVSDLARTGITIVSGLALGIDALSHWATLKNNGRTIAVLGSGIDQKSIHPATNWNLAQEIISSGGMIVSEYPIGTFPLKHHFPNRNRLISGLSLGVLVIEASQKSGALITANYALEQNREVFSVPGNIFSSVSQGTNKLVKMGAKTATCADDILEELNLHSSAVSQNKIKVDKEIIPDTIEEEKILNHLSNEPIHIDKLIKLCEMDASLVNSTLTLMEIKGKVKDLGGMNYILSV
jgi:DNA processing protein